MANSVIPFNIGDLKYMGTLNSSNDLNELSDGIYYIQASAPANAPGSGTVWCILYQFTPTASMIHQYIIKPAGFKLWARECSGSPRIWLTWTAFTSVSV